MEQQAARVARLKSGTQYRKVATNELKVAASNFRRLEEERARTTPAVFTPQTFLGNSSGSKSSDDKLLQAIYNLENCMKELVRQSTAQTSILEQLLRKVEDGAHAYADEADIVDAKGRISKEPDIDHH